MNGAKESNIPSVKPNASCEGITGSKLVLQAFQGNMFQFIRKKFTIYTNSSTAVSMIVGYNLGLV